MTRKRKKQKRCQATHKKERRANHEQGRDAASELRLYARRMSERFQEIRKDCSSYLEIAAAEGAARYLQQEFIGGADPNYRNSAGNTLLHLAAKYGSMDAVAVLIGFGADGLRVTNRDGQTPEDVAKAAGFSEMEWALSVANHGRAFTFCIAFRYATSHFGRLDVYDLFSFDREECVNGFCVVKDDDGLAAKFITEGAPVYILRVDEQMSATTMGFEIPENFDPEGIDWTGLPSDFHDRFGDMTVIGPDGTSRPLPGVEEAIRRGSETVDDIVGSRRCADYDELRAAYTNKSPLHLAVRDDAPLLMESLLVDQVAEPDEVNDEGLPALHYAIECGRLPPVITLVVYGASLDLKDSTGRTPNESTDEDAIKVFLDPTLMSGLRSAWNLVARHTGKSLLLQHFVPYGNEDDQGLVLCVQEDGYSFHANFPEELGGEQEVGAAPASAP